MKKITVILIMMLASIIAFADANYTVKSTTKYGNQIIVGKSGTEYLVMMPENIGTQKKIVTPLSYRGLEKKEHFEEILMVGARFVEEKINFLQIGICNIDENDKLDYLVAFSTTSLDSQQDAFFEAHGYSSLNFSDALFMTVKSVVNVSRKTDIKGDVLYFIYLDGSKPVYSEGKVMGYERKVYKISIEDCKKCSNVSCLKGRLKEVSKEELDSINNCKTISSY
jgi:predicted transcriptional regulator